MVSDNEIEQQLQAFGKTLEHHAGEPLHQAATSLASPGHPGRRGQRSVYLVAAAALLGVIGAGFWAASRSASDQIVPVAPTPASSTAPDVVETAPPETSATSAVPTSTEPALATTTTPVTPLQGCGDPDNLAQAATDLYQQILIARATDDLSYVEGCIAVVPDVFDGQAPNCWTPCESLQQKFLYGTISGGEVFSVDGSIGYSVNAAVSYLDDDGDSVEVIESWTLKPAGDGVVVEDFTVQVNFLDRAASNDTIIEYFGHIENEDWNAAALMLDDGAQNLDERLDLNRLDPASFDLPDIAASLAVWCELGCDTNPPAANDLIFDGLYGIERNGQTVKAAWFEGAYSILGLPIQSTEALAAQFDEDLILADDEVTEDEYRTMLAFLIECAESNGAQNPFTIPDFNELDQRFDTMIDGENGPAFFSCYDANGRTVDVAFQIDPQRTDQRDKNYTVVASCLETADYDYEAFFQQRQNDQPEGFPETLPEDLDIDDLINLGAPYAASANPNNDAILTICKSA